MDFVCGNINSPKLFKKYVESLEVRYGARMLSYHPKNKGYGGWHNFAFKATFANGKEYVRNRTKDAFTRCFIGTHIGSRPCCFECKFKKLPRVADITIGDFWGIENVDPDWDSPMGTSLVLLNNNKGRAFYKSLGDSVASNAEPLEGAIAGIRTCCIIRPRENRPQAILRTPRRKRVRLRQCANSETTKAR